MLVAIVGAGQLCLTVAALVIARYLRRQAKAAQRERELCQECLRAAARLMRAQHVLIQIRGEEREHDA